MSASILLAIEATSMFSFSETRHAHDSRVPITPRSPDLVVMVMLSSKLRGSIMRVTFQDLVGHMHYVDYSQSI